MMNRRRFLQTGLASGAGLATVSIPALLSSCNRPPSRTNNPQSDLDLEEMASEYRRLLFDDYLPFWENGGFDEENGGFMCYLFDDGTVQDDRKDIWYQGRGIWVYSFLYNRIDANPKWLEMAESTKKFMVQFMHRGDGTWIDTVDRAGIPTTGIDYSRDGNIYGALFAAVGLIELAKATGNEEDLELAKKTIRKSVERYENASYAGVSVPESGATGLRAQGHSFMFVWILPQLIELDPQPEFVSLFQNHLAHLRDHFWNPDYGISNETLFHDYTRVPQLSDQMVPGHSIEAQWMAMVASAGIDQSDQALLFKNRMRRLIEMNWDYVFGGIGDTDFRVFGNENHPAGPEFGIKSMWAQTEVLVGTLRAYSDYGDPWALDWYRRAWEYTISTMTTDYGVWRQAVDREGGGIDRPGISIYRKGNFHQPRCLMLNLLELEKLQKRSRDRTG